VESQSAGYPKKEKIGEKIILQ